MAEGCDISEHQGNLPDHWFDQWDYCIIRVFNEHGRPDIKFAQNWDRARGHTLRGAYGWPIPGADNEALGRQLVSTAPGAEYGYWADVEHSSRGIASAADTEAYLRGIGNHPRGFYSNIPECPRSPFLDAEHWWMADYGPNDGTRHHPNEQAPRPVRPWTIHQYTSNPLDLNWTPGGFGSPGEDDEMNDLERGMLKDIWDRTKDMRDGVPQYGVPPWHDITAAIARIEAAVNAGGSGGDPLTGAQVAAIVRAELDRTRLTGS